jgi:2-polyprenyl-3-methyl-5-hydroxy-6-metoxy-1,4-benzoquinol methylase
LSAEFDRLQSFIDSETAEKRSLRILEAGCGSISYIRFKQDVHIAGIDICENQLEGNSYLDEKILGDVQNHSFPPRCFDVIVCVDVLEHLPRPELALNSFSQAVADGGLVVLKMPNVLSVKGLATKILPHWLHKYAYKYLTRGGNSKDSSIEPFKTYMRFSIAPNALRKAAKNMGLETVYFDTYDIASTKWIKTKKYLRLAYMATRGIVKVISFNRIDCSEYICVLKRPSSSS